MISRCAAALLLLALCSVPVRAQETLHAPTLPAATAAPLGKTTYQARMKTPEGKTLTLADYKGKVIFLHYWDTFCGSCVAELPGLQKLWESLRGRDAVAVLMVRKDNYDDTLEKVRARVKFDFPLYEQKGRTEDLPDPETPVTYVIDRDGGIRLRHAEPADWSDPAVKDYLLALAAK